VNPNEKLERTPAMLAPLSFTLDGTASINRF